jgi:hypothetical protein
VDAEAEMEEEGEGAWAVRMSSQSFVREEDQEREWIGGSLSWEMGMEREDDFLVREPADRHDRNEEKRQRSADDREADELLNMLRRTKGGEGGGGDD